MNMKSIVLLLTFAPIAAVAAAPLVAQDAAPATNAERGAKVYYETGCYACHGTVGQGGGISGPALGPNLLPYEAFAAQLREPAATMPRYGKEVMSDEEIADIHAYLSGIPKGAPADSIKELRR
ncbi:MAG: cytochrome c [Sphingomonadales bacterium]|nr:MAG: cytochrome c [Sphingomonadales bacterium]